MPGHDKKNTLVVLYETKHVDRLFPYLEKKGIPLKSCLVVALTYEVERVLSEKDIAFRSLKEYVPLDEDFGPLLHRVEAMARVWHEHPLMNFFEIRGIRLGEALEVLVQFYLDRVAYYLHACDRIVRATPGISRMVVPHTEESVWKTAAPLADLEVDGAFVAFSHYARLKGILFTEVPRAARVSTHAPVGSRFVRAFLHGVLRLHNGLVRTFLRERPLRIFVSDYWRHVEPFISRMSGVELVFMDRAEAWKIGIRKIWKYRMRFHHPGDYSTRPFSREAEIIARKFAARFETVKRDPGFSSLFSFGGISMWPVVEPALALLVGTYSRRLVEEVLSFERLFRLEKINRILLRASMSRQHHFYLAAKAAEGSGIPSIELQHAGEIAEPTSVFARIATRYLAGYGPLTRDLYAHTHGYDPKRILMVGSPRFDSHVRKKAMSIDRDAMLSNLGLDKERPVILVSIPDVEVGGFYYGNFRLYDVANLFEELSRLQEMLPGLQYILSFREKNLTPLCKSMVRDHFLKDVVTIEPRDVAELFQVSDIVFSGHSTMTIEAMLFGRPVVFYPLRKWAKAFPKPFGAAALVPYSFDELVLLVTRLLNDEPFRRSTVETIVKFMSERYAFDGKAAERMASFLRELPPVDTMESPRPRNPY